MKYALDRATKMQKLRQPKTPSLQLIPSYKLYGGLNRKQATKILDYSMHYFRGYRLNPEINTCSVALDTTKRHGYKQSWSWIMITWQTWKHKEMRQCSSSMRYFIIGIESFSSRMRNGESLKSESGLGSCRLQRGVFSNTIVIYTYILLEAIIWQQRK